MFQLILVPWDASDLAGRALDTAVELAVGYEAEIVAASVGASPERHRDSGGAKTPEGVRHRLEAAFERARAAADSIGVPISHEVLEGADPADALLAYAHRRGFDLVVIGHHRHPRSGTLVLHGITEHLVAGTEVPLLVITEAAPTQDTEASGIVWPAR